MGLKSGEAWDLAKLAIENHDSATAERLLPEMVKSDQGFMVSRIVACWLAVGHPEANSHANRTNINEGSK